MARRPAAPASYFLRLDTDVFYSKETGGFYSLDIHGLDMPGDCLEISDADYRGLFEAQSAGKIIQAGADGLPVATDPPAPTGADRLRALTAAVQARLDAQAVELGYDDIKTAITYADEPAVAKFQAEGRALRAWRSMVWEFCYSLLSEVSNGSKQEPSAEQLLVIIPRFRMV